MVYPAAIGWMPGLSGREKKRGSFPSGGSDGRAEYHANPVGSQNYVCALPARQYHDGRQRSDWSRQIDGAAGVIPGGQLALTLSTKLFLVGRDIFFD